MSEASLQQSLESLHATVQQQVPLSEFRELLGQHTLEFLDIVDESQLPLGLDVLLKKDDLVKTFVADYHHLWNVSIKDLRQDPKVSGLLSDVFGALLANLTRTVEEVYGDTLSESEFKNPSLSPSPKNRASSIDIEAAMARRDSDSQSPDSDTENTEDKPGNAWTSLGPEDWKDSSGDGSKGVMSFQMPVPAPDWTANFIIVDINEPGGLRHMCFVRGCRRIFYFAWELHEHIRDEHGEQTLG